MFSETLGCIGCPVEGNTWRYHITSCQKFSHRRHTSSLRPNSSISLSYSNLTTLLISPHASRSLNPREMFGYVQQGTLNDCLCHRLFVCLFPLRPVSSYACWARTRTWISSFKAPSSNSLWPNIYADNAVHRYIGHLCKYVLYDDNTIIYVYTYIYLLVTYLRHTYNRLFFALSITIFFFFKTKLVISFLTDRLYMFFVVLFYTF